VPIINNVFIGNGKKVVVIGGGMAGLSAAYYMSRRGAGIELLEREKTVGGFCRSSIKNDKYILEYGPQYFYSIDTQIMKLARELSIDSLSESSRIDPNKRYIYDQGKFYKLPTSPFKMFTSSPLSILEKIRLAMEPFIKSKSTGMETVADFSKRRFGSGVLENIVGPVLSARFAGDPLCLEARAAVPELVDAELEEKSLLKKVGAFIPKIPEDGLLSFKWGMGTITARLEEEMRQKIMKGVFADAILSGGDGRYAVSINVSARELAADVVIIAVSAREASVILIPIYGIIGIIYPLIAVHLGKNSWYLRGIVYMLTFYVFQFAIGLLLRKIDLCPWKYSGALSINGLIRLQDAPLWFFLGLGIEFVYPLARAFSHVAI